jgi:hypothetical protein
MTMEQEWIRGRRPTAADGDGDGDVEMVSAPGTDFDDYVLVHWSYVGDAAPWRHTSLWKPPAEPAPTEADRIAALEQRVAELEAFKRVVMATPPPSSAWIP